MPTDYEPQTIFVDIDQELVEREPPTEFVETNFDFSQQQQVEIDVSRNLQESLIFEDQISTFLFKRRILSENLDLLDSDIKKPSKDISETLASVTSINVLFSGERTVSENTTLTDLNDKKVARQRSESILLEVRQGRDDTFRRDFVESFFLQDSEITSMKKIIGDSFNVFSQLFSNVNLSRGFEETATLSDSDLFEPEPKLEENLKISDASRNSSLFPRDIKENLSLEDSLEEIFVFSRSLTESLAFSDADIFKFRRSLSEVLSSIQEVAIESPDVSASPSQRVFSNSVTFGFSAPKIFEDDKNFDAFVSKIDSGVVGFSVGKSFSSEVQTGGRAAKSIKGSEQLSATSSKMFKAKKNLEYIAKTDNEKLLKILEIL